MSKISKYWTLIFGVLSPVLAAALGFGTYMVLTRASENRDADFVFRLSTTAVAMALPFVLTFVLAMGDRAKSRFSTASKIGLAIATLSLAMLYAPINGAISRSRQMANLALGRRRCSGNEHGGPRWQNPPPLRLPRQSGAAKCLGNLVRTLSERDARARPVVQGASL